MTEQPTPKAVLFLDFDGTITRRDAVDAILEVYADSKWLAIEEEWRAGRIGSRDCMRAQMALVRATRKQLDELLDTIAIDDGLKPLLQVCALHNIPVHVISDGFDYCLRRILLRHGNGTRALLRGARICASRLAARGSLWRTEFPFFYQTCAHGCATCKPAVMRLLNNTNAPAVFVGDGLSDQYAVECADLVFAKSGLAEYCRGRSIKHISFNDLGEVAVHLELWLNSVAFVSEEREELASA